MVIASLLQSTARALLLSAIAYAAFISLLAIPLFQNHAIYLHSVVLTWFQDLNFPEQWGFLPNQVTPFFLRTTDGETLHAWHILPLELYRKHETALSAEPAGLVQNVVDRLSFKLLRDDPESLLVLYFHGAAGTLGSGWRPPSYRAMYANAPDRIHTIAIDYRGFGNSTGAPSEKGLLTDALTLARWAMDEVGIPPERIVLFAQSIGTAVAVSLAHHLAMPPPPSAEPKEELLPRQKPIFFRGIVLVASFADIELLTATYSIAGIIPLLSPVARFPGLLAYLNSFIISKWPTKQRLAEFVRHCEQASKPYDITIIHAQDDWDIPWVHSETLFWHAIEASVSKNGHESFDEIRKRVNNESEKQSGAGSWIKERRTRRGLLRQDIVKYGLHDRIMSYPIVSLAVWRAFQSSTQKVE